jgi:transcriptional regulator with XRE-family HTH domain
VTDDRTFGQRCARLRELRGLTQADVAKRIGLGRTSVVNIEADRQEPGLTRLRELAAALDTTVGALLGEVPIPDPPEVSIVIVHNVVCEDCGTVADDVTADDAHGFRQRHIEAHLTMRPAGEPS